MADVLLIDHAEGVLTLTLNRPEKLNALVLTLYDTLREVFAQVRQDAAVGAVVLTGAGRAFCSGQDIAEFPIAPSGPSADLATFVGTILRERINPLVVAMRALDKPILAAVNGVAAGAGMSLALACDLRYAAQSARFTQAFVNIGLVPDAGSTYYLPRLVGTAKALELAWTGDPLDAQQALDLGLVNHVVPDEHLLPTVQDVAARLARGPRTAIGLIKRGLAVAHDTPLEAVLALEAAHQESAAASPDFVEGVTAFTQKRRPHFGPRG